MIHPFIIHSNIIDTDHLCEMDKHVRAVATKGDKWLTPELEFPSDCIVQFTPTFLAATRFMVWRKSNADLKVSIYLDLFDQLGVVGEPYWEIYNFNQNDGPWRYLMNEGDKLMKRLNEALDGLTFCPECEEPVGCNCQPNETNG